MKRWRYRRGVGRSRDAYTAPSPFGCTADDKNPYSGNVFVHGFGCGVEWRLARRYSRIQDSIYLGQGPPDGDSTGRRNHARNAFIDGILWIPILGLRFRILAGGFSASFFTSDAIHGKCSDASERDTSKTCIRAIAAIQMALLIGLDNGLCSGRMVPGDSLRPIRLNLMAPILPPPHRGRPYRDAAGPHM